MKKLIYFLAITALLPACKTLQLEVTNAVDANPSKEKGIFYHLPKTEYNLSVKYIQKNIKKGEYEDCIRDTDILNKMGKLAKQDTSFYQLLSIDLIKTTVPDSTKHYFAKFANDKKPAVESNLKLAWSSLGLLTNGELASENKGAPIAIKATAAVADAVLNIFSMGFNGNAISGMANTLVSEKIKLHSLTEGSSGASTSNQKQDNTCEPIKKLKAIAAQKEAILFGKASASQNYNLSEAYKQLETLEKKIMTELLGSSANDTFTRIIPLNDIIDASTKLNKLQSVFILSAKTGLKSHTDSGYTPNDAKTEDNHYQLKLTVLSSQPKNNLAVCATEATQEKAKDKTKSCITGVRYNIPLVCKLTIEDTKKDANSNSKPPQVFYEAIPQLGEVYWLPVKLGSNKNSINFTLDPETGILREFASSTTGFSHEALAPVYDQLGKVKDYGALFSPNQYLTTQTDYLKALKALKDAQDALKNSDE